MNMTYTVIAILTSRYLVGPTVNSCAVWVGHFIDLVFFVLNDCFMVIKATFQPFFENSPLQRSPPFLSCLSLIVAMGGFWGWWQVLVRV